MLGVSWDVYFEDEYNEKDRRAILARQLVGFFASPAGRPLLDGARLDGDPAEHHLPLDWARTKAACEVQSLYAAMEHQPADAIDCIGAAVHSVLFSEGGRAAKEVAGFPVVSGKVHVRISNHADSRTALCDLKSTLIGKLVTVKGIVVRASPVKPLVTSMVFTCKCGYEMPVRLPQGCMVPPTKCTSPGERCRKMTFVPDRNRITTVDWQKIKLQETPEGAGREEGRIPRAVELEVSDDLVDCCRAGDVIEACGVVEVIQSVADIGGRKGGGAKTGTEKELYSLYIRCVSVTRARRGGAAAVDGAASEAAGAAAAAAAAAARGGGDAAAGRDVGTDPRASVPPGMPALGPKDLEFVARYTSECEGQQMRHLVQSLCPGIYGQELVKLGLLLSLFGGVRKFTGEAGRVPVRGDIHCLIVGDPGLGKSHMLKAAAAAAPRGLYVCGNTASAAGLTVAIVRDPSTGEQVFEAGAVVLGDLGCCCVDEFDKMRGEHQALLEVMEQQAVSVAKAGLIASLPARTSVLAAANPSGGHYNRAKTVNENLKMGSAILSRFDLLFILVDRPDGVLDQALTEHVMAIHAPGGGGGARSRGARQRLLEFHAADGGAGPGGEGGEGHGAGGGGTERAPLLKRLREDTVESARPPLPLPLIRKYIAYARQYCFPVLSEEAKGVLQEFYLGMRQQARSYDGTPITARQLESLLRLAEARARLELREVITRDDAEDVVELMKGSLLDALTDEHGAVDFRRNAGKSKAGEAKRFLSAVKRLSEQEGTAVFSKAQLCAIGDGIDLRVESFADFIEMLNDAGELLRQGQGLYKVRCSSAGAGLSQAPGATQSQRNGW